MRTIMFVVIITIIIIPFYCTFDDNVTKYPTSLSTDSDTSDLYCCNDYNPFTEMCPEPCGGTTSYKCIQNGVEIEVIISCECCKMIWANNNYQKPIGLQCLPPDSQCPCDQNIIQY